MRIIVLEILQTYQAFDTRKQCFSEIKAKFYNER